MKYLKINHEELSALSGLPHLQQLLYLRGIKPFGDYRTGVVGLIRGISYQSLAEELYVEPFACECLDPLPDFQCSPQQGHLARAGYPNHYLFGYLIGTCSLTSF